MADSVGETLMQAMVLALNAPTTKPGIAYRTRIDALAAGELPAFVLYAIEESGHRSGPNVSLRSRTVRLEAIVKGEPPADQLVDPLFVYAVQTLFANESLQGQLRGFEQPHIAWETEPGLEDVCLASIDFEVVWAARATDPTARFG